MKKDGLFKSPKGIEEFVRGKTFSNQPNSNLNKIDHILGNVLADAINCTLDYDRIQASKELYINKNTDAVKFQAILRTWSGMIKGRVENDFSACINIWSKFQSYMIDDFSNYTPKIYESVMQSSIEIPGLLYICHNRFFQVEWSKELRSVTKKWPWKTYLKALELPMYDYLSYISKIGNNIVVKAYVAALLGLRGSVKKFNKDIKKISTYSNSSRWYEPYIDCLIAVMYHDQKRFDIQWLNILQQHNDPENTIRPCLSSLYFKSFRDIGFDFYQIVLAVYSFRNGIKINSFDKYMPQALFSELCLLPY